MSDKHRPPSVSINAFNRAKNEYKAALNGMCETCTDLTTKICVGYHPPADATEFDPEYFLARCQSCARRGRTELIKVRLAHVAA